MTLLSQRNTLQWGFHLSKATMMIPLIMSHLYIKSLLMKRNLVSTTLFAGMEDLPSNFRLQERNYAINNLAWEKYIKIFSERGLLLMPVFFFENLPALLYFSLFLILLFFIWCGIFIWE